MGSRERNGLEIAIVGMAARLPGSPTLEELWTDLCAGREGIATFSREELLAAGVPESLVDHPDYVPRAAVLEDVDRFDAGFFDLAPREAEILDPQQRLFLEVAWEALERAGHARSRRSTGVFAGVSQNSYLLRNLLASPRHLASAGAFAMTLASEKDYLATRLSYKLDLGGPSVTVQTACSTSLVAVHLACQSLIAGECDVALAGGSAVRVPDRTGYLYQEGGINSPDGHNRTFDVAARGTVKGQGVGAVVLRLLDDALADGDHVHAVILGSAINNDGGDKAGFTAPRRDGQARAIRAAQLRAEVEPGSIGYVECHGTATPIGDPIEMAALTRAFRQRTDAQGFCAVGSIKSNIGHADAAAGVAGLIKTSLVLENGQIPPTLHYGEPNPEIDFASSPFHVADRLLDWPRGDEPRRAAVSSFGIGGTNAHVVLEEAPPVPATAPPARPVELVLVSARSKASLAGGVDRLAAYLPDTEADFSDVAFTLQAGRRSFEHRAFAVAADAVEAARVLAGEGPRPLARRTVRPGERSVVFLFPGQGSQHPGMGRGLYDTEPLYRRQVDECAALLEEPLGLDLRDLLFPAPDAEEDAAETLRDTRFAQPALFVVEHALARLFFAWGIEPSTMVGHSIGEFVAATLAGVFERDDALALVAERGRMMSQLPLGSMVSVDLDEAAARELLARLDEGEELEVAAVNAPSLTVLSGPQQAVERLVAELEATGVGHRPLHTSHAFHSAAMEPLVDAFADKVAAVPRKAPERPFVSNLTGRPVAAEEVTDPAYWGRHLRQAVRFGDAVPALLAEDGAVFLEVGPGRALGSLVRQQVPAGASRSVISAMRHPTDGQADDTATLVEAVGRLWLAGIEPDWAAFHGGAARRRVPTVPTYAFDRRRYWVEPQAGAAVAGLSEADAAARPGPESDLEGDSVAAAGTTPAPAAASADHYERPELDTAYAAPEGAVEERLAEIWQELLGIAPVGRHDDFFELGGHSLLGIRLFAELKEQLAVELPLGTLFEASTPARLAPLVAAEGPRLEAEPRDPERRSDPVVAIEPDPDSAHLPFPLTDVQEAYWIGRSDAMELGNVSCHIYFEGDFEDLDVDRIEAAWRRLIDRHDMLRGIVQPDGLQRILADVPPYRFRRLDLTGVSPDAAEDALGTLRSTMSHQVLPADEWPLYDIRASFLPGGGVRLHISFDLLISDAWSFRLMQDELNLLYREPDAELAPLAVTFRDYRTAELALEESDTFLRARDYWLERVPTLPPPPDLPMATSPAAIERPTFARRRVYVHPKRWEALKRRARKSGLTSSGVLLAAFAEVLAVWSRSRRFSVVLTLFNRILLHPDIRKVVGDFTSLTLLAAEVPPGGTFEERARVLQQRLWNDLEHRSFSSVRVMREIQKVRGWSGRTAIPVVFTSTLDMDSGTGDRQDLPEVVFDEEPHDNTDGERQGGFGISQTPQTLIDNQVTETHGWLRFGWDWVEELFPAGLIEEAFDAYARLVGALADGEKAWQAVDPLLVPAAALEARRAANDTAAPVPSHLLHEPFFERALDAPERPAVIAVDRTVTYGELARHALGLAERLDGAAQPDRLIAVVLDKDWRQAVACCGILVAGGAYMPVAPDLPAERLHHLLERGEVAVVVTSPRLAAQLPWPDGVEVVVVDEVEPTAELRSPERRQEPTHIAYVIFTSGSTGEPKGVVIDHRGAANTVADVNRRFRVGPDDRVLAISALNFDLSVYDLFGPLGVGGALVLPDPERRRDPASWAELVAEHRVTVWNSVPALVQMLVDHVAGADERLAESLRLVMMSGDWIPVPLPDRLRSVSAAAADDDGLQVISLGGATEASIWSILHPVDTVDPRWSSIPYGRPMDNQTFHVLDPAMNPCPVWVPGELYIGGVGVALGYWRDPERTAASFVEHPETGERLYRTGDLGRYLPDGEIEFLGREDFQVKIQGYRIELGEIEVALSDHPRVSEAVVAALGEARGEKRLVAYVVAADGGAAADPVGDDELRSFLADRLPPYMVPPVFVVLEEMPLTANGKVDRKALPQPQVAAATRRQDYEAPKGILERRLAQLWQELLGVERVGRWDGFFDLGGQSLVATRLMAALGAELGVRLPLRALFEAPTVAGLAAAVTAARGEVGAEGLSLAADAPLEPVSREGDLPLSFGQQRFWFLDRLDPGNPAHNLPTAVRLEGPLDLASLARAVDRVRERHESLRTTYHLVDGRPVQRVHPHHAGQAGGLPVVDLAALPASTRERELRRWIDDDARRPFDLGAAPMLRAFLLRLGPEDAAIVATMHHIASDGWSIGVLMDDLRRLYAAFAAGDGDPLAPLAVQVPDFAVWQRRHLTDEVLGEQLDYWRDALDGAPAALELPTDRPRPSVPSGRGASLTVRWNGELAGGLDRLARDREATPFMALLALVAAVVGRWTDSRDLSFGTPIAHRTRPELEPLVGFFANSLVLRTRLDGDPTVGELVERSRETALGAYAHQALPFERLVEELAPERDTSRSPLFQVLLVLQNLPDRRAEAGELTLKRMVARQTAAQFDLSLYVSAEAGGLTLTAEYSSDLLDATTVRRLLGRLETVARGAVADPELPLSRLPATSRAERHAVVHEVLAPAPPAGPGLLHELVVASARRWPEAVAVVHGDDELTYGELDRRSAALARELAGRGVGPDVRVGVCVERTLRLPVALLAVLRAGGASVPLDPTLPAARLALIAEDAELRLLVTEDAAARASAAVPEDGPGAVARLELDRWWSEIDDTVEGEAPKVAVEPENLSHVIYTSGSTGRPKGVAIIHRGAAAMVRWAVGTFDPEELAGVAAVTSVGFDLSVFELFVPLAAGGTAIVARDALELASLPERARQRVRLVNTVPSVAGQLLAAGALPAGVRSVNLAGEALPAALVRGLLDDTAATRVANLYGPSEDTTYSTWTRVDGRGAPPIGRPVDGTRALVVDRHLEPRPLGVPGELVLAGFGLARGYLGRPARTAESFVPDPFCAADEAGSRLYRTGDLVRRDASGELHFLGRLDHQVKLRGYRIELGEIEAALAREPSVGAAAVLVRGDGVDRRLVAYVEPSDGAPPPEPERLRDRLRETLPGYMVPAAWEVLERLPRNANGKVDRRALPEPRAGAARGEASEPASVAAGVTAGARGAGETGTAVAEVWAGVLDLPAVGLDDNFFDLGGHSLLLFQVESQLEERLGVEIDLLDLFRHPTVQSLAAFLDGGRQAAPTPRAPAATAAGSGKIAIVSVAGRFPGAPDVDTFWDNLLGGVESVVTLDDADLERAGVDPALRNDPAYVRRAAPLDDPGGFDAGLFGFTPREAEVTDPQHRLFLECAWEALERAGYDPLDRPGRIGVFAGAGLSRYLLSVASHPEVVRAVGGYRVEIANDKDYLTTLTSYKLDLKGPSMAVQTACSTSLVATHLACRSLLEGQCDMAFAGGASIQVPQRAGYLYQEGGIASPDGTCRAFDADAAGTVRGSGVGVVLLKRLEDALADGDPIHAVILGSAVNNDGSAKVGYTAPSIDGQAGVIRDALAHAGVEPDSLGYVEAHGTGTALGDPIEITALAEAYGGAVADRAPWAIGSVKSNIGHLDTAAGVAGLIKAALAVERGELPPSLHFERPNPRIDFAAAGFRVQERRGPWPADRPVRRAAVSSFGIGGTNAHLILEEPPRRPPAPEATPDRPRLLMLSARSEAAVGEASRRLARHLEALAGDPCDDTRLADVAHTLAVGRHAFDHRRAVVADDLTDAARQLADPGAGVAGRAADTAREVVFLLPGQGAQHPGMGQDLYRADPVFRQQMDRASDHLAEALGLELVELLYGDGPAEERARRLQSTDLAQPALLAVEHALARWWMERGVRPVALIGHSLGEFTAACLAGVFTLEDALDVVAGRGRLIRELARPEAGAMASLPLGEDEVRPLLGDDLALAAVNGVSQTVVSGPAEAIDALLAALAADGGGIVGRRLHTSHAFHSDQMTPVLGAFRELVASVPRSAPRLPFVSNVTGTWIEPAEATDPDYWARHLVSAVRFADGLGRLLEVDGRALLEVGPGRTLTALARRHPDARRAATVVRSLPHPTEDADDRALLAEAVGRLWVAGVDVRRDALFDADEARRVRLPAYPFERQTYWLDPRRSTPERQPVAAAAAASGTPRTFAPYWKPAAPAVATIDRDGAERWVVVSDGSELAAAVVADLEQRGLAPRVLVPGDGFDPLDRAAVRAALTPDLDADGPLKVVRFAATSADSGGDLPEQLERWDVAARDDLGAAALLVRVLGEGIDPDEGAELVLITRGAHEVTGGDGTRPELAALDGLARVAPREVKGLTVRRVDLAPEASTARLLLRELLATDAPAQVALRQGRRWLPELEELELPEPVAGDVPGLGAGGVVLVAGGLGGVGLELAEYLARTVPDAGLVLVGRRGDRARDEAASGDGDSQVDVERLVARSRELADRLGIDDLAAQPALEVALDRFVALRLLGATEAAGVEVTPGSPVAPAIRRHLDVAPEGERLLAWLLEVLEADGLAARQTASGEALVWAPPKDLAAAVDAARARARSHDQLRAIVSLVDRSADRFTDALAGRVDALDVLFDPGEAGRADEDRTPETLSHEPVFVRQAAELVADLADRVRREEGRPLRVLEVGAGQGRLTRFVVAALGDRSIQYDYTDLGRTFVVDAERRAREAGIDWMSFGQLDVSRDPVEQGYEPASYDLVLALNVVHATPDLVASLGSVHRLLRPGGWLALVEKTRRERWVDAVWGLTAGWWLFDDDLRAGSPLVDGDTWETALGQAGFETELRLPPAGAAATDSSLLVARRPGTPVGRRPATGERIERLEAAGARVMTASADVTDPAAVDAVVDAAIERFGRLDGVIHAAGVAGGGLLSLAEPATLAAEVATKVRGTLVLADLCRRRGVGWLLLSSSTSSRVGVVGQAGYSAANNFLDAWAASARGRDGVPTLSVGWDRWRGVGMAVAVEERHRALTGEELGGGIDPDRARTFLGRLLASDLPQVVVAADDPRRQAAVGGLGELVAELGSRGTGTGLHRRPEVSAEFVAPQDELEVQIAGLWCQTFGLEEVGVDDDFFELGGDSLVALQLAARLERELEVDLPVQELFDHPTVASLALAVEEALLADASDEELAAALAQLETDDE